ncbi:MAG: hypothetical protein ACR2PS_18465 [Pseudomonadales bacterium]
MELYIDMIYSEKLAPSRLSDGMGKFVREWKYSRWPTIGELLEILKPAFEPHDKTILPPTESWAESVMKLPEGQIALTEGYGREVYLWAEKNPGKIPGKEEMQECHANELRFRDSLKAQIDRARGMDKNKSSFSNLIMSQVLRAGATMDGFENKLKKRYLELAK